MSDTTKSKMRYEHYVDVPWYRQQWIFWVLYFTLPIVALGILVFGDVYFERGGKLRSFGLVNRVFAGAISAWVIYAFASEMLN